MDGPQVQSGTTPCFQGSTHGRSTSPIRNNSSFLRLHFYNTTHSVLLQGKQMMKIFCEKVVLPFLECNTARQAVRIKNINDQMTLGRRGEKRSTNPASNKTNFTPKPKKITTPVQIDSDTDEANNSILIMSTIHPVEYLGTPPPSNTPSSGRLEIQ